MYSSPKNFLDFCKLEKYSKLKNSKVCFVSRPKDSNLLFTDLSHANLKPDLCHIIRVAIKKEVLESDKNIQCTLKMFLCDYQDIYSVYPDLNIHSIECRTMEDRVVCDFLISFQNTTQSERNSFFFEYSFTRNNTKVFCFSDPFYIRKFNVQLSQCMASKISFLHNINLTRKYELYSDIENKLNTINE